MPIGDAILSNGFKLEITGGAEIVDIREFPDMLNEPESLDTTTMGDTQLTARPGLKGSDALTFTLLFSGMGAGTNWAALETVEATGQPESFTVTLPSEDELVFSAFVSLGIPGRGPNEVMEFTATLTPSTAIAINPD